MKSFETCSNQLNFPMCHGKSICTYCSEYKTKDKVIFESEEEARRFHKERNILNPSENTFITELKRDNLIQKSPVEEAEDMYRDFSESKNYRMIDSGTSKMIEEFYKAIQYLKSENENLKDELARK